MVGVPKPFGFAVPDFNQGFSEHPKVISRLITKNYGSHFEPPIYGMHLKVLNNH